MLSEEALIVAAVVGACALLVLGVLELMWPTRRRRPRRPRAETSVTRPVQAAAAAPARPVQSILPRRLIDSPSASRPSSGFMFPPPAVYVPPPLPSEEIRPIRRPEPIEPTRTNEGAKPSTFRKDEAVPAPSVPDVVSSPPPAPAPVEALEVPSFLLPIDEPVAPPEPMQATPPRDLAPLVEVDPPLAAPPPREVTPPADVTPPVVEVDDRRIEAEPTLVAREPWFEPIAVPSDESPPSPVEVELISTAPSPAEPIERPIELEPPPVEPPLPAWPSAPPLEPELAQPAPSRAEPAPSPGELVSPSLEPAGPPREPIPAPTEPPMLPRRRRSKISPHARPHRVLRPASPEIGPAEPPTSGPAPSIPVEPVPRTSAEPVPRTPIEPVPRTLLPAPRAPLDSDTPIRRDSPLVERCFALYQEKRYDEVLTVSQEALEALGREAAASPSRETAALWSVLGLAKQAMGDDDGARAALESSIDAAPESERGTYRRHLATLALEAAQSRLARAASHDPGERMAVIRGAITWTERGLAVISADPALADARDAAHDALWQAYEQAATVLLQRQEFGGARQILHEALDDPKLPAARAAGFRGLLSGTFGGEIGQLTAQAILGMQEGRESEALGALRRAESLLETIPADALPQSRRNEVDQRLWWGYAELGSRRLDAGAYEDAFDPLVHALRFSSIGAERQAETRAAVVRTLEGIAAVRALSIRRLAESGSRDEAIVAAGELHALVKRGLELGLGEEELLAAFARVRRLCEELGMDTRA